VFRDNQFIGIHRQEVNLAKMIYDVKSPLFLQFLTGNSASASATRYDDGPRKNAPLKHSGGDSFNE
jgi:hypothetical protein